MNVNILKILWESKANYLVQRNFFKCLRLHTIQFHHCKLHITQYIKCIMEYILENLWIIHMKKVFKYYFKAISPEMFYLIFSLITATQSTLHGIASLYSYLPPNHNTCCGFFRFFHYEATATHAKCWGNMAQYLRQSLQG